MTVSAPASDNPFRVPAFRLVWLARVAAVLGVQTQGAAVLWQVYEIARRDHPVAEAALWLSLVGLVQFLPLFALALPAGTAADRRDRKVIMGLSILVEAVCAAAFLGLAFMACTLLIAGLPPLSGFVGKFAMLTALLNPLGLGASAGLRLGPAGWALLALMVATGLLALIALTRAGIRHFWASHDRATPRLRVLEGLP